jgi:hypothetical protein
VDEIQKVTVTAVPADATDVVYTWTSANESVATVNAEGIVRIIGVGTTTVTVTSGTFSKTVPVEGTIKSITLKDEAGGTSGTYPYNGTDMTFTITATTDPVADVTPVWSSSAEHVTVAASEDGMSALVTVSGTGAAVVTAAVGDIKAEYNIATTSVFESAVGYWTFEDADLGKATIGDDLKYTLSQFSVVAGPSPTKKAVRINHDNVDAEGNAVHWRGASEYQGFLWNHGISGASLQNYTVLMDARAEIDPLGNYYIVFSANDERARQVDGNWVAGEDGGVSGVSFRARSGGDYGDLTLNQGGVTILYYARWGTFTKGEEPWVRLVYSVSKENLEEAAWKGRFVINGQVGNADLDVTRNGDDNSGQILKEGVPVRFMMAAGNNEDNNAYDVSTIAVWDRVLTDAEIASLGGVSK